jgi:hypothetical protein
MTYIPTPQRTDHQRVVGEFYPLQKQELIALKSAKLINNAAFVHLALRYENPFCDRPIEILPKEFALRWGLPESSIYEAIGKLKKLGVLLVKTGKAIVEWVKVAVPTWAIDSQFQRDSDHPESLRDYRSDSEIPEKILESQNPFPDPRLLSEISENHCPEPLPSEDSSFLQTIQIIQTHQTELESEVSPIESGVGKGEEKIEFPVPPTESLSGNNNTGASTRSIEPIRTTFDRLVPAPAAIPQDLIDKLEELHIPLDSQVRGAIASHQLSQAYGAAAHVSNTLDTIKNPRAVFLYQLPKQPVEKTPSGLSTEFLSWYEKARDSGIVEDVKPQYLPSDYHNEPLVRLKQPDRLTGAPYTLVDWRQLQADPSLTPHFQMGSSSQFKKLLEQLKLFRRGKNSHG